MQDKASGIASLPNDFREDYREKAHLQKGFNANVIDDLIAYILRVNPEAKVKPIRLIDLCCGDGGSTHLLLKQLDNNGIQVESLVGYDISEPQIKVASEYARLDKRLRFEVKDINTLVVEDKVDVVLSLFGLHWINDIKNMALKIKGYLNPEGILMFFVPLETDDIFELRTKLMQSPKWISKFSNFSIKPFISDGTNYFEAFSPLFTYENKGGIYCTQYIDFELKPFVDFISSWMPEIRYLEKEDDRIEYAHDLINNIPVLPEICSDVKKVTVEDKVKVSIYARYSWFHGRNKIQEVAPQECSQNLITEYN